MFIQCYTTNKFGRNRPKRNKTGIAVTKRENIPQGIVVFETVMNTIFLLEIALQQNFNNMVMNHINDTELLDKLNGVGNETCVWRLMKGYGKKLRKISTRIPTFKEENRIHILHNSSYRR